MSRSLLIPGIVIAVALLIVLLLKVILDNPEIYRQRLGQAFQEQTGFELNMQGDVKWRLFPPVAIEISQISITPQGFDEPLARLGFASFDLKLSPLLFDGKLVIDGIRIDGLEINAVVDEQGLRNWETGLEIGADDDTPATKPRGEAASAADDIEFGFRVSVRKLPECFNSQTEPLDPNQRPRRKNPERTVRGVGRPVLRQVRGRDAGDWKEVDFAGPITGHLGN